MTISDIGSLSSAAFALLALVVAVISLHKTNKFNARQVELADTTERLNRLLIEREMTEGLAVSRADISANLYQAAKHDYRLKIFNKGKGVARNVRIVDLGGEESILITGQIEQKFPLPILEQHQSAELIAAISLGSPLRAHIKLQWDDDAGVNNEKELTPSL